MATTPLLLDVETGAQPPHVGWAEYLRGSAPLLSQLPVDLLCPSSGHRRAAFASQRLVMGSCTSMGEASLVAAFAATLGRYARADEVALGVWRNAEQGRGNCLPLRLSLLHPPEQRGDASEDSAVTPASWFLPTKSLIENVTEKLNDARLGDYLDAQGLKALDQYLFPDSAQTADDACRSLEVGILFGQTLPKKFSPKPSVMLVCPKWPQSKGRAVAVELHYTRGTFSDKTAMRVLRHLESVLYDMTQNPDALVCDLRLFCEASPRCPQGVNEEEGKDVLSWADAYTNSCYRRGSEKPFFDANVPITQMVDSMVYTEPQAMALMDDATGKSYTYTELQLVSWSIARVLRAQGVCPDALVPIMAPRGANMVFGLFGILYAGGAYVPLDLHWPDDRVRDVLEQCKANVVLGTRLYKERLGVLSTPAPVLCIDDEVDAAHPLQHIARKDGPGSQPRGNNLVYVFFTSGTTGKPKGVMVEHKGLSHRIHWFQQKWPISQGDGIMLRHAYTFGLSEWEIFWPLTAGATLLLAPPGGEKDADYILRRTCNPQINIKAHVFVPSMLQMVMDRFDELEGEELRRTGDSSSQEGPWWRTSPLRQIITCGEALGEAVAQRAMSRLPNCGVTNLYGPTEGEMTVWECPLGKAFGRVAAGAPMWGSKAVMADLRQPRLAASLEPAEITFGGPFIARGYLGRPDLTDKAFVTDFTCPSGRIYLTGDLGRWREGELELLGRKDFQVKLRGFRIELGEIESAIKAAGANAAVCVIRPGAGGAPALVAYYEPGNSGSVSEAAVRASCKKRLPPYMQPQVVVLLDKLPRNANGKVDRPKLPAPPESSMNQEEAASAGAAALPSSSTELAIAETWAEVLRLSDATKVPTDVDFQELGGSSLLAGRATACLRKALRLPGLPGTVMYQHPTIQRLAAVVDKQLVERDAQEAAEALEANKYALAPALHPQESFLSSTRPWAMFLQSVGVLALNFLFESEAWSPFWWACWFMYEYHGRTACILFLPVAFVGNAIMMVLLIVGLKWLVVGRLKPGKYPLWSTQFFQWWFVNNIMNHMTKQMLPLVADTPLANLYYRLLGAKIGDGVRIGVGALSEPDLVTIGDGATIGKKVQFRCAAVCRGMLHLGEVKVGTAAAVGHCAVLPQGACVPDGQAILPLSTAPGYNGPVGSIASVKARELTKERIQFQKDQDLLRVCVGIPWVLFISLVNYVPCIFVLEWTWALVSYFFDDFNRAFYCYSVVLAWVYVHPLWISFLAVVILQKKFIIGKFEAGPHEWCHWEQFRHWLHARAVESHAFEEVCEMWVNTDVLSFIYRMLGAKVGRRVQIDAIHAVEHDLIHIEDYTVFGSEVLISCDSSVPWITDASKGYEPVRMGRASNVLDHCVLCPGTVVGEKAVLGTCTLAHHRSYFPPLVVHSGSVRGRSMYLRTHNPTPKLRELEDKAMQRLDNPFIWYRFNLVISALTMLCKPVPEACWIVTYFVVTAFWDPEQGSLINLLTIVPFFYTFVSLVELLLVIGAKWLIIGKFKEGDFPFFSAYHVKWMFSMILKGGTSSLGDALEGTAFNAWVLRLGGAKIGKNCFLAGLAVEYDLLEVGDNVAIGDGCDTTGHTVENMVIKLAKTKIQNGASLLPASFAMPGSVVGEQAVILEHSQVLKGETVPMGEAWAGMPAAKANLRGELI